MIYGILLGIPLIELCFNVMQDKSGYVNLAA